jgi:primosomal protein N' (replication factor Y)
VSVTFADVALRLPARQLYTYRVPASLTSFACPGMRVVVPVRRETAVGVVRSLHGNEPNHPTRELIDLVDRKPMFTADLLKLADWLSDYYFCSPGEALFAMVPSGLTAEVDTVYHHEPERVPTAGLRPKDKKICYYIAEHPGASRQDVLTAFPQSGTPGRLEGLVNQGTVKGKRRMKSQRIAGSMAAAVEWSGEPNADDRDPLATYLQTARGPVLTTTLSESFPHATRQLLRFARRKLIRRVQVTVPYQPVLPEYQALETIVLNADQKRALAAIESALGAYTTFLLHGVTGSGKTEIYIRAMAGVLERGGTALYLVPEIGLANHLLARLAPHFRSQVVMLHSGLTEKDRALAWRAVRQGERRLVVGTRSAALCPLKGPDIVIVDEEQDASLKQDSPAPRYHGRDVAIWRARQSGAVCILGTATPSLESWHHARQGKYELLSLPIRVGARKLPRLEFVDRRKSPPRIRGGMISEVLASEIDRVIASRDQVILFLNRRGFSGALRCTACGQAPTCTDCSVAYTYHRERRQLRCHFCGRREAAPEACAGCDGVEFSYPRAGTQQVENELTTLFPGGRIGRLDLDTVTRRGQVRDVLAAFGRRELDVLLGTQMVTKGLHFPGVALVGILNTDMSLDMPDFRAAERTAQQVLQVAGRAGRGDAPGAVYAQTYNPNQPVFAHLTGHDYAAFATAELAAREALRYPPYSRFVVVWTHAADETTAETGSRRLADTLRSGQPTNFRILGPAPAPIRKLRRQYRWHLLLVTNRIKATLSAVGQALELVAARGIRHTVDVDPATLL